MEPEETTDVEETVDEVETSPAMAFAESVMAKATALDAGDLTVEEFVAQVTEELNAMQDNAPDMASPMGGLGIGGGAFNLPEPE